MARPWQSGEAARRGGAGGGVDLEAAVDAKAGRRQPPRHAAATAFFQLPR